MPPTWPAIMACARLRCESVAPVQGASRPFVLFRPRELKYEALKMSPRSPTMVAVHRSGEGYRKPRAAARSRGKRLVQDEGFSQTRKLDKILRRIRNWHVTKMLSAVSVAARE